MQHRFTKSRAGKVMLGAILAGALNGAVADLARANLTLDIESGSGTPAAPTNTGISVAAGSSTTFTVFAVVTGADSSTSNEGFGGVFAAFDAESATAGALSSLVASTPASPFTNGGVFTSAGTQYGPVSDGTNTHVGTGPETSASTTMTFANYNNSTPTGWFFAAYLTNNNGTVTSIDYSSNGTTSANASYFKIGTLNFTAGSSNGSVTLSAIGREETSTTDSALWAQDSVPTTPALGAAIPTDSISITVGSTVANNPGDVNGDGVVNNTDLNIVIQNFNKSSAGLGYSQGNLTGDPTIDNSDLNVVIQNFNKTYSTGSVALVPEPASLMVLSGIALAFTRRRRSGH